MSDHVMRGLKVQLTTTMDSVLRTALFEIIKVFENALQDHKLEVAQKGEEIAQLKIKLQTAEIKLKDLEFGRSSKAETKLTHRKPDAPGQSSTLPKTDFEVPDDWCAPLGYERAKKQKLCPSVTLRQISIPLNKVPIKKKEVLNSSVILQRRKGTRRSRRISSLEGKSKPNPIKEMPYYVQGVNISSVRSDNTILLRDVKHEDYILTTNTKCLRKPNMGENTLTDKRKVKASKHQKKLKKHATKWTKSAELTNAKIKGTKKYSCMFCSKLFEGKQGRNIHARYHRTCIGCKKVLDGVYSLGVHKQSCAEYKKRMAKEAKNPPNICDRSSNTTVKPKVVIKKETLDVSINNRKAFNKYTASHKEHANVIDKNGEL